MTPLSEQLIVASEEEYVPSFFLIFKSEDKNVHFDFRIFSICLILILSEE